MREVPSHPFKLILFDFDGTLVDSQALIAIDPATGEYETVGPMSWAVEGLAFRSPGAIVDPPPID